jgi:uncharacterized phage protein (TIGR01671 family)
MRTIKFRGKRVDNGEWVYGGYTYDKPQNVHYIIDFEEGGLDEVLPETVGQFYGSEDKNGKEIYEGDIVKYDYITRCGDYKHTAIGEVKFVDGSFSPLPISKECEDSWYSEEFNNYEVLGDVFSNPELLKG